jgi:hypothetical protein
MLKSIKTFTKKLVNGVGAKHRSSAITQTRFFSLGKGTDKLNKLKNAIDDEIAFEESQLSDYQKIFGFFQKDGWEVTEITKSPLIRLTKKINDGCKIQLVFQAKSPTPENNKMAELINKICQDPNANGQIDEDDRKQSEEINAKIMKKTTDFSVIGCVYINFANKNSIRVVMSFNTDDIEIMSCAVTTDSIDEDVRRFFSKKQKVSNEVEFEEIENTVQTSMNEFLLSAGIDQKLSNKIQELSMAKDQKLYYDFLSKFSQLVDIK